MNNNKRCVLLLMLLLISYDIFPQINTTNVFGVKLRYALIDNNCLYTTNNTPLNYNYIPEDTLTRYYLNGVLRPETSSIGRNVMGFSNWDIVGNQICDISLSSKIGFRNFGDETHINVSNVPIRDYKSSFYQSPNNHYAKIFSSNGNFWGTFNQDIYLDCYENLWFYFRDTQAFYVYSFDLAKGFEDEIKGWTQENIYTRIDYETHYPPFEFMNLKKKPIYKSIKDSLFFCGNFKVIDQGNNKFIFNPFTGRIYLIQKRKIIHIGTIELDDNYLEIRGDKLLIEDRGNKEIIVFAPVHWEKGKYAKPAIKIMADEEMKKRFKNLTS